jgi:hypothetical protein
MFSTGDGTAIPGAEATSVLPAAYSTPVKQLAYPGSKNAYT